MNNISSSRILSARLIVSAVALLLVAYACPSRAAVMTYQDGNANDVWDLGTTNWNAGVAWTNSNQATFSGTGETVDVNANILAISTGAILFTVSGYTIADSTNDGTLTLGNAAGGILIQATNSTGTNTISEHIILGGGGTKQFSQTSGGTLRISGDISQSTAGTVIQLNTSGSVYRFDGTNTYSGGTSFGNSNVRLNIGSAGALGTGALTLGNNTGTIDNVSGGTLALANNNALNLTSVSGDGVTFVGSNDLDFGNGAVTLNGGASGIQKITVNGSTLRLGGSIGEGAAGKGIQKLGVGTLVLGGSSSNYTSTTTVTAGVLRITHGSALGTTDAGTTVNGTSRALELQGGISVGAEALSLGGTGISNAGSLRSVSGNNSWAGLITLGAAARIASDANKLTLSGGITSAGSIGLTLQGAGNMEVSGAITSGVSTLAKEGVGTVDITGGSAHTGVTTVTGGTLLANSAFTGTGAINVNAGGTLGGASSVAGAVTVNASGSISPGNSPGTFTINNNLTLNNDSIYLFEGGDLIDVNGTLDLNDNWKLTLQGGLQNGGQIVIFTYDTLAASPDLAPTFDWTALGFDPDLLEIVSQDNQIILKGVSLVPEPNIAILLLAGLAGFAVRRVRRA